MGAGAFGIWKLLILLGIIVTIFGTKKLKNLGSDLGSAIKGFKTAMDDGKKPEGEASELAEAKGTTFDVKSERVEETR